MKNNDMDKIQIFNSRHPKARFNLSHDVNSTYQFGEVQPVVCRQMIPQEKDVVQINSLVRLAPMVAPTFGRIKHKEWHYFVPFTDLFPHFGNFFAETSYAGKTVASLLSIKLGLLSYMCLIGAKFTLYFSTETSDGDSGLYTLYKTSSVSTNNPSANTEMTRIKAFQGITNGNAFNFTQSFSSGEFGISVGNKVDLKYFIPPTLVNPNFTLANLASFDVPTANFNSGTSWYEITDKNVSGTNYAKVTDLNSVSLEYADAVLPYLYTFDSNGVTTPRMCLIACRFSNFGKRLYKILVGCGYQLDFTSTQVVSLMPLFAFYKAWFDNFGLTRLKSWKDTAAYNLLFNFDKNGDYDMSVVFKSNNSSSLTKAYWIRFLVELGNAFVTEDTDFVSAHLADSPATSPTIGTGLQTLIYDNSGATLNNQVSSASVVPGSNNKLAKNDNTLSLSTQSFKLSALGVKELMSLYRWCNRNTIAGKEIEKLLRAQGFGYYLYSCKSNFIGYTEQSVQVYDVVNSSDTYDTATGQGMLLGDYAGRGIGYDEHKPMTFEADEHGYWIGLCAIVPESGYSAQMDATVLATRKLQMYNPEFDGLGYQLTPKSVVSGSLPFSTLQADGDKLQAAFGFLPTYSAMKVARNVSNGGFSLRSGRKIFTPYMLDKILEVGERSIALQAESVTAADYRVIKAFNPDKFPVAGDFWRFVNRYPWLGNFDRIFAVAKHNSDLLNMINTLNDDSGYEYVTYSEDNFMVHHVVNQQAYANMLPIESSFGTDDDGALNDSIEQA